MGKSFSADSIDLQNHDVCCWFVPHDLHPAMYSMRGIEETIDLHGKLLPHSDLTEWLQTRPAISEL
jgi:hypothetical protein